MANISIKEPVHLRRKQLANGNVSLYLDVYLNGKRSYEFLKLYLIPERSRGDKERNKHTLSLANSIKAQRVVEIQRGEYGIKNNAPDRTLFYEYFESLTLKHKKNDSIGNYYVWVGCLGQLKVYDDRVNLTLGDITPKWIEGFRTYLDERAKKIARKGQKLKKQQMLAPNTRKLYFDTLLTAMRTAVNDGLVSGDLLRGIKRGTSIETRREYLTLEEVRAMTAAECDCEETKRAFLFSCLTGLRRSDVERLTWGEVSVMNGRTRLVFRQKKTKGLEYLDIADQAAELIGERGNHSGGEYVFEGLKSAPTICRHLNRWAKRAGIDKYLTFHVGRHTFAVLMLTLGTDIYTVSKLLGHRELKTTQIYAKVVDAKKQAAVDNIPRIL